MQLTCGNLSGIMAPFIYRTNDAPRYIIGHAVSLAMLAMALVIYIVMWFWFRNATKRRAAGREDWKAEGKSEEEVAELGDASPRFIYTY